MATMHENRVKHRKPSFRYSHHNIYSWFVFLLFIANLVRCTRIQNKSSKLYENNKCRS